MKFKISPYFLLLIFGIGFLSSKALVPTFVWAFVIAVSVIVHEMGHALTALFFGQKVEVELVAFGGVTKRSGKPLEPWKNFVIILFGPLFGLVLFYLCFIALPFTDEQTLPFYALSIGVYVNLFWTVINLLPVQPMDGGKLFGIILEKLFGYKGIKYSYLSSAIFAAIFALVGFLMGLMIVGILFSIFAVESFRAYGPLRQMTAEDISPEYSALLEKAKVAYSTGDVNGAKNSLEELLKSVKGGNMHVEATELLAKVSLYLGQPTDAFNLLKGISNKLSGAGTILIHRTAADLGEWEVAKSYSDNAYQVMPSAEVAELNATIFTNLNEKEAALGWSARAAADRELL